jgi:choline-sulfatase
MKTGHGSWLTAHGIWNVARLSAIAISLQPFVLSVAACSTTRAPVSNPAARNVLLITIDTLRADHVGAYGWTRGRTATLDAIARNGVLFERAYAAAPITLPSHATLLTGRYPPGHGSRDNGLAVSATVPTLATELHARGFATAAFVAAFPLDRQFGLGRGFDVYGDRMPRGADGKLANERPAADVVNDAISWLRQSSQIGTARSEPRTADPSRRTTNDQRPFFLWVHVFEPHAPYGTPAGSGATAIERYDEEIATADREIGRLIAALGPAAANTLIVAAGDHGEAFGEHGEYAHSIFVYDTTLRVPLLMTGPGVPPGTRVPQAVTLADVAPTVMHALGAPLANVDGIDLSAALARAPLPQRELYAESFAPLVEFGWAPLRALRSGSWKLIAAPKPELFQIEDDREEMRNQIDSQSTLSRDLERRVNRYSGADLPSAAAADREAAERLRALGYASGSQSATRNPQSAMSRPDPKDRRDIAARIAQVTSGELSGAALLAALEGIVRDDPRNVQAQLRLGYALLAAGNCGRAEPAFTAAIDGGLPSADAHLGLATCLGRRNDVAGAERVLLEARRREPGNPVITANLGLVQAAKGDVTAAIASLSAALDADPGLHEARFNLAILYMKAGRRPEAAATARDLLGRLPAGAPQRSEVERLLRAVQ